MTGAVLTNYSANFSTDGNSTESFSLTADNKTWLLNEGVHVIKTMCTYELDAWYPMVSKDYTIAKILAVEHDKRIVSPHEYDVDTDTFSITFNDETIEDTGDVYTFIAGKMASKAEDSVKEAYGLKFKVDEPNDFNKTIKRRGHIQVELFYTEENQRKYIEVTPAQSVSIDVSLNREDIPALGFKRFYDRPLALPIDVTASIDVIFTDLELFAQLCSKDAESDTDLSLDDFRNDLGLKVTIFDRTDVDGKQNPVKILEIPRLIPSDEVWNISLDGQATQTFSFRGMELIIKKGSE
jgi:hypothetical protein